MRWKLWRGWRGMSLVEVVVGIALMLIVFTALFGALRATIALSTLAKVKVGAREVATNQMEYLRGLSYDAVGTVGGTPSGAIAQTSTTTMNGISYGVRTSIDYYDDAADGSGGADTNGITRDYKRAQITVTYTVQGSADSLTLISNFAPPGVETNP